MLERQLIANMLKYFTVVSTILLVGVGDKHLDITYEINFMFLFCGTKRFYKSY